jgi:hypothetical protein
MLIGAAKFRPVGPTRDRRSFDMFNKHELVAKEINNSREIWIRGRDKRPSGPRSVGNVSQSNHRIES